MSGTSPGRSTSLLSTHKDRKLSERDQWNLNMRHDLVNEERADMKQCKPRTVDHQISLAIFITHPISAVVVSRSQSNGVEAADVLR